MSLRSGSECTHVIINSSAGTVAVVAAVPRTRVYIYRLILVISTPGITLTIQDTASAALSASYPLAANGSITLDIPNNFDPWWTSGVGLGVQFGQTGTTLIGADVYYLQGP